MALATGAALGIAPLVVPILTLGAICHTLRKDRIEVKVRAAQKAAEAALKASREHAPAVARASTLIALEGAAITLDSAALHAESSKGATGFNERLANQLADGIRFQPDDGAARNVVVLIFTACIAQIRADGDFDTAFTQQMLLDAAQANKVQISLLNRIEKKVDDEAALAEACEQRAEERHQEAQAGQSELKDLLVEALERTGKAAEARASGVTEARIVALAQEIVEDVTDPEAAFEELTKVVAATKERRERRKAGSNAGTLVDDLIARIEALADAGKLEEAQKEANDAVVRWEADEAARQEAAKEQGRQLLDTALQQDLDLRDYPSAATRLVKKADLEAGGRAEFNALRALQDEWQVRGRDKGLLRDQEVSIALAELVLVRAEGPDQRGTALNDLGISLKERGERDADPARLEAAIAAYEAALEEWTRDRVPLDWALTQNNLGNAFQNLGERTSDPAQSEAAVAAYEAALEERTRGRVPLDWAMTQNNLGVALTTLGERTPDAARLESAVAAYAAALEEWTQDRVPLDWAMTQNNLAHLERARFDLSGDPAHLDAAQAHLAAALEEWTRDRVPLDWALTQSNLANFERARFDLSRDPAHLDAAESHLAAAREVFEQARATQFLAMADTIATEIAERRAP